MNKRDFLKAIVAANVSVCFQSPNALANTAMYIEYNRDVCSRLDGLIDYQTGKEFAQNGFAIAYFCTPYNAYPGEGCDADVLNIYQSKNYAEKILNEKIQALMVISPSETNDPKPNFVDLYTDPNGKGNFHFTGLTGSKERILETARNYRAAFNVNRNSGQIVSHSRSAILISPKGELLVKYAPENLANITNDIVRHVKTYKEQNISPAQECEP